jgi:hypothetical protein
VHTIEEELLRVVQHAGLSVRQGAAVIRRLGWDGRPPATLAVAAAEAGYTRERVRQLERRLAAHLSLHPPAVPATMSAVVVVARDAPSRCDDVARTLVAEGLTRSVFAPGGILRAAELAGLRTDLVVEGGAVMRRDDIALLARAHTEARRLVTRDGAARVADVARRLGCHSDRLRPLLDVGGAARWLETSREWFLVPAARTRVTGALRKLLTVSDELRMEELELALRRPRPHVSLPREVLCELCRSLDWLHVDGDSIRAAASLDNELSPLEETLVGIFRNHGPVLPFGRIALHARAAGMRPETAAVYLSRSPLFRPVSRARYALAA